MTSARARFTYSVGVFPVDTRLGVTCLGQFAPNESLRSLGASISVSSMWSGLAVPGDGVAGIFKAAGGFGSSSPGRFGGGLGPTGWFGFHGGLKPAGSLGSGCLGGGDASGSDDHGVEGCD